MFVRVKLRRGSILLASAILISLLPVATTFAAPPVAYESMTGTNGANMDGAGSSDSVGFTGNWSKVNATKTPGPTNGVASYFRTSVTFAYPSNSSYTLPASTSAAASSWSVWELNYSARQLTNSFSFDTAGTYYMSYLMNVAGSSASHGSAMVGLLSGLPSSTSDTSKKSLLTGYTYNSQMTVDNQSANTAVWNDSAYSSASGVTIAGNVSGSSYFVLVKYTGAASGNDRVQVKAYAPSATLPSNDSAISWDVDYSTPITGTFTHLGVQMEYQAAVDEVRLGATYGAVAGVTESQVMLSNYGAANACIWPSSMNYGTVFYAGTASTITKVRLQYAGNTLDSFFANNRLEIYADNAGAVGSLLGTLAPDTLEAATTLSGATVATRTGTFIGSTNIASAGNYWLAMKPNGSAITACQGAAFSTQASNWAPVKDGSSNFQIKTDASSYSTFPSIFMYEITRGEPDITPPIITGPGGLTTSTISTTTPENAAWSYQYTANEAVNWSLSGADSATFTLNQNGTVSLGAKNFEVNTDANTDGVFALTVTATDGAGNASSQTLSLTITDENEAPIISTGSGAATFTISAAENQTAVITYSGYDPDAGGFLGWYINGGVDRLKFDLNVNTGTLTFKTAPDFEVPTDSNTDNIYVIGIAMFDGAILTTQTLSVQVTNVNESATLNRPTVSGVIYKGIATTISVTGDFAGKVRFFVGGKVISTCKAVSTTGSTPTFTASCSWKPAVQGGAIITARITPTNQGITAATTPAATYFVVKRTTTR